MIQIRPETQSDIDAIRTVTKGAFADVEHSNQTEFEIVDALRTANAIRLSLVAIADGELAANVVFSDVLIDGNPGWVGLGPVSVKPAQQRCGIGTRLIEAGLERIRSEGAFGCVLVGDPGYYRRFGFRALTGLSYDGIPDDYVLCLSFSDIRPSGKIVYHPAFGA